MQNELIKKFNDVCNLLGIDPMVVTLLIALLLSMYAAKDIKNWKEKSSFAKHMDIAVWFALFLVLLTYLIKFIRGD